MRSRRGPAAHFLLRVGEAPEKLQRGLERKIAAARFEIFLRDFRIKDIVTQVGGDLDLVDGARRCDDRAVSFVHINVERQGRHGAAFDQRESLHHVVRQHGDLVARHINGGQAAARDVVQR